MIRTFIDRTEGLGAQGVDYFKGIPVDETSQKSFWFR